MAVFSLPFHHNDLPLGSKVFKSQLVTEVKSTDMKGIWELKIRHVIVGTPQQRKLDFEESYSPIIDPTSFRLHICLACGSNHICGIIDISNAFQNTIGKAEDRIYVSLPPGYLEWARLQLGFKSERGEKYYVQMFNSYQGTKDAGNRWYTLITSVIEQFGFIRCHVDHAYFVKHIGDNNYIYLSLATDDIFVSCKSYAIFDDIVQYMRQFFELTTQTGSVLKFLGLRIIQSNHAISLNQGEYVFDMLCHYFGKEVDHVKTLNAPMRYDGDYEKELADALPLTEAELKKSIVKYKGTYRFWTGKLMFLNTQT